LKLSENEGEIKKKERMERRSNHHESGKDWDWDWDALAVRLASIVGEAYLRAPIPLH